MAKGKRQLKLGTVIKRAQKLHNSDYGYLDAVKYVREQLGYTFLEAQRLVTFINVKENWDDLADQWCPEHKYPSYTCSECHVPKTKNDLSWETKMIRKSQQEHREANPDQYAERVMEDVEPATPRHIGYDCGKNCGLKDECNNPWHNAARWIHADINNYYAFQKRLMELNSGITD